MSLEAEERSGGAPTTEENAAVEPAESAPLLYGSGQSAWLAVLTVGVGIAIALSVVALMMANDEDAAPVAAPTGPQAELTVSMTEFAFDPPRATLTPDAAVTAVNDGSIEHNWTVLSAPIAAEAELADVEELFSLSANAGEEGSGSLDLDAGTYQVICTIAGHFDAGMVGEISVQ